MRPCHHSYLYFFKQISFASLNIFSIAALLNLTWVLLQAVCVTCFSPPVYGSHCPVSLISYRFFLKIWHNILHELWIRIPLLYPLGLVFIVVCCLFSDLAILFFRKSVSLAVWSLWCCSSECAVLDMHVVTREWQCPVSRTLTSSSLISVKLFPSFLVQLIAGWLLYCFKQCSGA